MAGPQTTAGAASVPAQHTRLTVSAASLSPVTSSYTQPTTQPHAQPDIKTCHFGGSAGGTSVQALDSGHCLLFFQAPQPPSPPAQAQHPSSPLDTSHSPLALLLCATCQSPRVLPCSLHPCCIAGRTSQPFLTLSTCSFHLVWQFQPCLWLRENAGFVLESPRGLLKLKMPRQHPRQLSPNFWKCTQM